MTGEGIEQLLETIALQAEVLELKANPKQPASGTVLEALLDRGRGPVARVLVQDGTLRVGDFVLAGAGFGKVRAMTNEHGKQLARGRRRRRRSRSSASTKCPARAIRCTPSRTRRRRRRSPRAARARWPRALIPADGARSRSRSSSKRIAESEQQELRVIIKGDVQGSVEAVADALAKLSTEKVKLSIIHAGVGAITEGDVNLAIASQGDHHRLQRAPRRQGQRRSPKRTRSRSASTRSSTTPSTTCRSAMEGLLPATLVEKPNGKAEVRQIFKIKGTVVAGCYVIAGRRSSAPGMPRSCATATSSWTAKSARSSASRTT